MGIVKKFKDFFKPKQKVETENEKSNRLHDEVISKVMPLKDELEYNFTDFEDLGAKVSIGPVYKTERTFKNGSKLSPGSDNDLIITHIGYLKISIEFESMNIDRIEDDFPDQIRRCLIESIYRMNDNEGTKAESAWYRSRWSNRNMGSPERKDIILINTYNNSTPEDVLNQAWGRDYFRVKMWTKKDADKISRLRDMVINIYTKPIKISQ